MYAPASRLLTGDVLDRYMVENLRIRSDSTRRHYRAMMKRIGHYLERPASLDDLDDLMVAGYLRWLESQGLSVATVKQHRDYIAAFWAWAARRRLVEEWPNIPTIRRPEITPRAWTKPQIVRLMQACLAQRGIVCGIPASLWWAALYYVIWDTGERVGAVLDLRWDMLDLESGELDVPASIRKGKHKGMLYHLKPATLELLRQLNSIRGQQWVKIFPWVASRSTFYDRHKELLQAAGLPTGRRNGPQKMRRSFASHLEAAGGNATEALGHSARRVTTESYIDPSVVKKEPPNRLLFDL